MNKAIQYPGKTIKFNMENPAEKKLYDAWQAYASKHFVNSAATIKDLMAQKLVAEGYL